MFISLLQGTTEIFYKIFQPIVVKFLIEYLKLLKTVKYLTFELDKLKNSKRSKNADGIYKRY